MDGTPISDYLWSVSLIGISSDSTYRWNARHNRHRSLCATWWNQGQYSTQRLKNSGYMCPFFGKDDLIFDSRFVHAQTGAMAKLTMCNVLQESSLHLPHSVGLRMLIYCIDFTGIWYDVSVDSLG
jgi:hypothetical protein